MTNKTMEKREIELESLSISELETKEMIVEGYALKWESLSRPIVTKSGTFHEYFKRGAFDRSIEGAEQLVLYGHDINQVLGRTSNGTAELRSDDVGLYLTVKLPNTTLGRDTYEYVKRGDITGMSVGFIPITDEFVYDAETDKIKRSVEEAILLEVSLVPMPAYESSDVSLRAVSMVESITEDLELTQKALEDKRKRLELLAQL